jgi:predicted transcriptional regulator
MVNLDERTLKRLDELAAAARLSRSAMVRRLVAEARPESVSSPCASTP